MCDQKSPKSRDDTPLIEPQRIRLARDRRTPAITKTARLIASPVVEPRPA